MVTLEQRGEKLFGILHQPEGPSRGAILIVHGFGGHKIGSKRLYVMQAQALEKVGFTVLRLDMRGCGDSEGEFGEVTIDSLVEDTRLGLDYLEGPKGIIGSSLGGPVALEAIQTHPVEAVVLWAPVGSGQLWQEDWAEHYPQEVVDSHIHCGGQTAGPKFREQFVQIDTRNQMPSVPTLHIHGEKDRNVFPHHADYFEGAEFVKLPNSGHSFGHSEERDQLIHHTTEWFSKHL